VERGPETTENERRDAEPGAAGQPPDFRVGDRLVRPSLNRLVCDGEVAHVEPKLMRVLVVLAERPRRVVGRRELLAEVWEARHVSDSTVTRAIATLRRLLGDDANRPRFIETIPKRGYRLIAPVTPAAAAAPEAEETPASEGWVSDRKPSPFGVIAAAALGAAAAAALMALGGSLVRGSRSGDEATRESQRRPRSR
jgi:DNA-binding winged helix-turn-helix (wHTH) protein